MKTAFIHFVRPELFHVLVRRLHVVARIHGKHQDIDKPCFDSLSGYDRIMAGKPDTADCAGLLEAFHIFDEFTFKNAVVIRLLVAVMDHSDLDVIGLQAIQKVFKRCFCFGDIASSFVLAIFPRRTDVSLNDEPVASSPQGCSNCGPHLRIGRVDVNEVDPVVDGEIHHLASLLLCFACETFASERNCADFDSGSSELTVYHCVTPVSNCFQIVVDSNGLNFGHYLKSAAICFMNEGMSICCGHFFLHAPQPTQAEARSFSFMAS